MMVGIPGSGKSHHVKKLKMEYNAQVVSPDDIRRELTGDISDQTQNGMVWKLAREMTLGHLEDGRNVILDATNTVGKNRASFIKDFPEDTELLAKLIEVNPEIAIKRVKRDIENGIDRSNVPVDVIKRMYEQLQQSKTELTGEGFRII
jgi:predicted kinase